MESTIVKEYTTEGGRHIKETSDGRIFVSTPPRIPGSQFGALVMVEGEVTDEKLAKAKEKLVDEVCRVIREIANEKEEFFIINEYGGTTSVGHKFLLPTVEGEDGFSRFKEDLIVK